MPIPHQHQNMMSSSHTQSPDISLSSAAADDFEFAFAAGDDNTPDEISATNTVYPIFGRERSGSVSSTASSVDDLEPQSYCAWAPRSVPASPDRPCKKSSSTGSALKGWRLRDLVVGRSRSDGKDKFVFLEPPAGKKNATSEARTEAKAKAPAKDGKESKKVTEMDMATAHRLYYSKATGANAAGGGGQGRRSFLPYKNVGFVGLSRNHPF